MASFTIEGMDGFVKEVNQTSKEIKALPAQIVKVLSTVRNKMLNDTISGIDYQGRRFKPYSKMYQAVRLDNNRQSSPVSLTWHGDMVRSMKAFRIANGGEIRFDSTRENTKAVRHNDGIGVPKREFFGLSKNNIEYIEKRLLRTITL